MVVGCVFIVFWGHLVAVFVFGLRWVWGRVFGGFCELEACSLHGLFSGVEKEIERMVK